MSKKENTATATEQKVKRISTKDKAVKHIARLKERRVSVVAFDAAVTAYAAIGIIKYDTALEMSDKYAAEIVDRMTEE